MVGMAVDPIHLPKLISDEGDWDAPILLAVRKGDLAAAAQALGHANNISDEAKRAHESFVAALENPDLADPSREWQPGEGIAGSLSRLWGWLEDAAAGKFDVETAMYHAVGGVLHQSAGVATLVIREEGPSKLMCSAYVIPRTEHRSDFTYRKDRGGDQAPVISLSSELPLGATGDLGLLLKILDDPYGDALADRPPRFPPQSLGFVRRLLASSLRNPDNSPQYFVLAIPRPAGGAPHLLAGRLAAPAANGLRVLAGEVGVIQVDPKDLDQDATTSGARSVMSAHK
jgi:hypothetical protein